MLHMNFAERVVIETASQPWQASPMSGVWRKPLARAQAEAGHATSIVRYDAGSRFRAHTHPRGEEILVLEGVFSDEDGDYPAGSYLRNPAGSQHSPFSVGGCTLLVKLHQFQDGDVDSVRILPVETSSSAHLATRALASHHPHAAVIGGAAISPAVTFRNASAVNIMATTKVAANSMASQAEASVFVDQAQPWQPGHGGLMVLPLHSFATEHTALVFWPAGEHFVMHRHVGGEEIFVISGEFADEHGRYPAGTWLRSPHMSLHQPFVEQDTLIWVKTGHLALDL